MADTPPLLARPRAIQKKSRSSPADTSGLTEPGGTS